MARAKIFAEPKADEGLDLEGFAPKREKDPTAVRAEDVKAIAEAGNFHSREAAPSTQRAADPVSSEAPVAKRKARTHRTGRNVQFNVKAAQTTIDAFYEISDEQGWVLGETLEKALAALKRELSNPRSTDS